MPSLDEVSYSREDAIAAVRSYYDFLVKLYLPETCIAQPPPEGWPHVQSNLGGLGKTKEVIELLSHLPYIKSDEYGGMEVAPSCVFANWEDLATDQDCGGLRIVSEGDVTERVPAHMIGLAAGGRSTPVLLLDTKLGVVHWYECLEEIRDSEEAEAVTDDPYDYAEDDAQAEWLAEGCSWAISDFFEVLKGQFRDLSFIPLEPQTVFDVYHEDDTEGEELRAVLQGIYREHGWPDVERYRKDECLQAIKAMLLERFPDFARES